MYNRPQAYRAKVNDLDIWRNGIVLGTIMTIQGLVTIATLGTVALNWHAKYKMQGTDKELKLELEQAEKEGLLKDIRNVRDALRQISLYKGEDPDEDEFASLPSNYGSDYESDYDNM